MQSTRYPFGEKVVPHPPGAIGPIAGEEAGANLRAQFFIAPAAPTARSCQPSIEPTPRDTERPAQPSRRPDPPVATLYCSLITAPIAVRLPFQVRDFS